MTFPAVGREVIVAKVFQNLGRITRATDLTACKTFEYIEPKLNTQQNIQCAVFASCPKTAGTQDTQHKLRHKECLESGERKNNHFPKMKGVRCLQRENSLQTEFENSV